ncbi:MAG: DsbA family protein [Acetobacteraceae bacterium]|nr:DsbA family protein [Acetobacteraceae bacterium]
MPELVWYFDPVSPFAHLALPAVERLAARRAVILRPVVFGAILKHWGQLGPAEIEPKRRHTYRLVTFQAQQAGLALRFPPRHPFRSLEALRLLAALDSPAPAVRAVFDFIWGEGRDPSDPGEAEALRQRLGAPPPDEGAKERLRLWTEEAIARGVFGVPTLAAGSELFWGADAMPMAEAYLADPALFVRGALGRLAAVEFGAARR